MRSWGWTLHHPVSYLCGFPWNPGCPQSGRSQIWVRSPNLRLWLCWRRFGLRQYHQRNTGKRHRLHCPPCFGWVKRYQHLHTDIALYRNLKSWSMCYLICPKQMHRTCRCTFHFREYWLWNFLWTGLYLSSQISPHKPRNHRYLIDCCNWTAVHQPNPPWSTDLNWMPGSLCCSFQTTDLLHWRHWHRYRTRFHPPQHWLHCFGVLHLIGGDFPHSDLCQHNPEQNCWSLYYHSIGVYPGHLQRIGICHQSTNLLLYSGLSRPYSRHPAQARLYPIQPSLPQYFQLSGGHW